MKTKCMSCGGSMKKMAVGGNTTKRIVKKSTGGMYGIPQENMGTSGQYGFAKKGGATKAAKFAALAPPYNKATFADKIAGAKKNVGNKKLSKAQLGGIFKLAKAGYQGMKSGFKAYKAESAAAKAKKLAEKAAAEKAAALKIKRQAAAAAKKERIAAEKAAAEKAAAEKTTQKTTKKPTEKPTEKLTDKKVKFIDKNVNIRGTVNKTGRLIKAGYNKSKRFVIPTLIGAGITGAFNRDANDPIPPRIKNTPTKKKSTKKKSTKKKSTMKLIPERKLIQMEIDSLKRGINKVRDI